MGKRWRHKDQIIKGRNQVLAITVATIGAIIFAVYALSDIFKIPALHPAFAPLLLLLPLYRFLYTGHETVRWILAGLFALCGLSSLAGGFMLYAVAAGEFAFLSLMLACAVCLVACFTLLFSECIGGFLLIQQEQRRRN